LTVFGWGPVGSNITNAYTIRATNTKIQRPIWIRVLVRKLIGGVVALSIEKLILIYFICTNRDGKKLAIDLKTDCLKQTRRFSLSNNTHLHMLQ
jgi:hypothetical protein